MIASEEYEPNTGWDYAGFGYLAGAGTTMEGLGASLVNSYIDTTAPIDPTVTLSMLDLRRYPGVADTLEVFTQAALQEIDASAAAIGRRRDRSVRFGFDPNPQKDWFMVDLGQMLSRIGHTDVPVADEAAAASAAIDALVVVSGTGEASEGAQGISVHFPPSADAHWPDWYRAIGDPVWSRFLDGYFDAGRALPPERRAEVVDTSPNTTFFFDEYGLDVTAVLTEGAQGTVTSATMWSGIPEDDGSVTFYSSDQGLVEGAEAWAFYDLTRLELSDGVDTAVGFQQVNYNEEITFFTITVPVEYRAPIDASNGVFDDPIDLTLKATVDLDTDEISIGFFITEFGTVAPFTADPTGLLFPKLPVRAPDGTIEWLVTIDVGLWADLDTLGFDFIDWPAGTPILSELTVTDFGGYRDVFTVQTEVPQGFGSTDPGGG
jgi:hypothetical protein